MPTEQTSAEPVRGSKPGDSASPAISSEPEDHIGENLEELEKDERSRTVYVLIAVLVVIAVGIGVFMFALRPKAKANGTIQQAVAVALPGDQVLASITVNFNNIGGTPLWVRAVKARLTTADGQQYTDDAASPVDFDRYFRGYPDLREHSSQPLKVETKVEPGDQLRGSVIVAFPVTLESFNQRKSLSLLIYPYAENSYAAATAAPGKEDVVVVTQEGSK